MSTCSIEELFLYSVPAAVMYSFCEIMDSLDDTDWKKFASVIIQDQTQLRLLDTQRSRTQAVMWHWINRNARVGELLTILRSLGLLRALNVFQSWSIAHSQNAPLPPSQPPRRQSLPPPYPHPSPDSETQPQEDKEKARSNSLTQTTRPPVLLPLPGPPPQSLLNSSIYSSGTSSSGGNTDSGMGKVHPSIQESVVPGYSEEIPKQSAWNLPEVIHGTNNFSQSLLIGEGGFGCVYKATMRHTEYAVKRLKQDSELDWSIVKKSFITEIEKLSCLRHPNIVDLAGYCMEGDEYCLIYLYLPNGSLEHRLHHQGGFPTLTWQQRVSILQGAACGIQFLHSWHPCIIHGDIKSSNILLDQALTPKLGDFGLARFSRYSADARKSRTVAQTTTVRGTLAYLPDEYVKMGKLTFELDTYSFGVVLLENLTGRKAIEEGENKSHSIYLKDLVEKERSNMAEDSSSACKGKENKLSRLASHICHRHLDVRAGHCPGDAAQELCLLACRCLERQKKRPGMEEVFNTLKRLQELFCIPPQVKGEGISVLPPSIAAQPDPIPPMLKLMSSLLLTPEENTYKFTPCGKSLELPNMGSVRPYGHSDAQYDDQQDSFCSMVSSGSSLRTFQGTPNVPVESDESFPDSCLGNMSPGVRDQSARTHESGQQASTSPGLGDQSARTHESGQQASTSPRAAAQSPYRIEHHQPHGLQCLQPPAGHVNYFSSTPEGSNSEASDLQVILPHHQIVMNPAKQRFVEQVALYEQGKINSLELLSSGIGPGPHLEARGYPEESDEFQS